MLGNSLCRADKVDSLASGPLVTHASMISLHCSENCDHCTAQCRKLAQVALSSEFAVLTPLPLLQISLSSPDYPGSHRGQIFDTPVSQNDDDGIDKARTEN